MRGCGAGGVRRGRSLGPRRRSLLAGPEPEIRCVNGVPDEIRVVAAWVQKLVSAGYCPAEIAIFARTGQVLRDRPSVANAGLQAHELADHGEADPKGVANMHRSKGLQYRAVAVIGVETGELPLERVLDRQADEAARAAFLELERNLHYVACTRARERLLLTGVREIFPFLGG